MKSSSRWSVSAKSVTSHWPMQWRCQSRKTKVKIHGTTGCRPVAGNAIMLRGTATTGKHFTYERPKRTRLKIPPGNWAPAGRQYFQVWSPHGRRKTWTSIKTTKKKVSTGIKLGKLLDELLHFMAEAFDWQGRPLILLLSEKQRVSHQLWNFAGTRATTMARQKWG